MARKRPGKSWIRNATILRSRFVWKGKGESRSKYWRVVLKMEGETKPAIVYLRVGR